MNIEKLKKLGLQKAVTACLRHSLAMSKTNINRISKHRYLHELCDDVARELYKKASVEERKNLDCINTQMD